MDLGSEEKSMKAGAAPAQANGLLAEWQEQPASQQRSTFDKVNSGYWDVMRQYHWADAVMSPRQAYEANYAFFRPAAVLNSASNKLLMYCLEPTIAGGLPGAAVGAGVGGSLLAMEHSLGRILPVLKQPAAYVRNSRLWGRTLIGETAYAGATVAIADYGISMVADRCLGVNSPVAKILEPNLVGTALATAGVLLCHNPKVGFAAGYIAGKVCNYFRS